MLYFRPDQTIAEINSMFAPGDQLTVDLQITPPALGQSMTSSSIIHWSWGGNMLYFRPDHTIAEINSMFATGYQLKVELANSPALGQSMTSSDIIHWSWDSNRLFFRPDQTIGQINSMFVSGYQLQVEKIIPDTETYEIQLSPAAAGCWKPGTEVLLTSHTRNQDDQQVAVIESSDPQTGIIHLVGPIERPISVADHPDFAVEVASLNRRIVFEADDDADDEFIGGHFVVHHTSSAQHIEGVEIRNFGQQGRLGKYPLHFHMCGDSPGSQVKKNVV
jgi:hypothetical protein